MGNHLFGLFAILAAFLVTACGIQEPRYTPYKTNPTTVEGGEEESATSEDATEAVDELTEGEEEVSCEETALAVFELQISGAVNGSCTNCHSSNNPLILINNQSANNRAALLAYGGTTPEILIDKIHQNNGETHGGGDQAGTLGEAPIREWLAAEGQCE